MPIYEYRCEQCSHELERLQRMGDEPLRDCPSCGKPALKRLISAAGFRLKGGGWYETDFKPGAQRNLHDSGNEKAGAGSPGHKEPVADKSESKKSEAAPSKDNKTATV